MNMLRLLCSIPFFKKKLEVFFKPKPNIQSSIFNIQYSNKIGLGAGFDKNAKYLRELQTLGFGFVEIGTVTPKPQKGNDKPRLFRLPKDRALINRMGFNNDGVEAVAERLKKWRKQQAKINNRLATGEDRNGPSPIAHCPLVIGGNIGKNKTTPNEDAWKDYEICFRTLHPYVDFFVVNVSSPNTPGLRELQEKDALKKILTHLQTLNKQFEKQKPVLLKIAPDLSWQQIDDVIALANEIQLDGIVATNTTISREQLQTANHELQIIGAGGLSGKPLKNRSTEVIRYIHQKTSASIPIIGSGGIFNGDDAKEKLNAGASLIEVWTGFIYAGPLIVKRIAEGIRN